MDTIDDALIDVFVRCVQETHSDCHVSHQRLTTTAYFLHCDDSRGHEEVFVGFTPKEQTFVNYGRWVATNDALDAKFVTGQCGLVYSNESEGK